MAQKKFKYPLIIEGDWQSLVPALEALGYQKEFAGLNPDRPVLVTNSLDDNGVLCSYRSGYERPERTTVDAANRDLVLALAAALEGTETHKGEAFVFMGEHAMSATNFTKGVVYFLAQDSLDDSFAFTTDTFGKLDGFGGRGNRKFFRKATKEEIIEHFRNTEIDGKAPNAFITSEEPVDTHISVRKAFIKDLYDYADDEAREALEKEFPSLFPRPTFRVGETIVLFNDGAHKLMIIGGDDGADGIALVDLADGMIKSEAVSVEDFPKITEKELLEAGEGYGLTRCNYAKFNQ